MEPHHNQSRGHLQLDSMHLFIIQVSGLWSLTRRISLFILQLSLADPDLRLERLLRLGFNFAGKWDRLFFIFMSTFFFLSAWFLFLLSRHFLTFNPNWSNCVCQIRDLNPLTSLCQSWPLGRRSEQSSPNDVQIMFSKKWCCQHFVKVEGDIWTKEWSRKFFPVHFAIFFLLNKILHFLCNCDSLSSLVLASKSLTT